MLYLCSVLLENVVLWSARLMSDSGLTLGSVFPESKDWRERKVEFPKIIGISARKEKGSTLTKVVEKDV